MVQVHGRRVSKRLHHLQSHVVFIVVVVVVWRRARHFVGRRERERERERVGGDRKTFEIQRLSSNSLSLSFLCCLLFTNERNLSLLRVFLLKYFSVLCLCVRVTSLRPQACVILL